MSGAPNDTAHPNFADQLPAPTRERFESAGIDLSQYPFWPAKPDTLAAAAAVRSEHRDHQDPGLRADKSKAALFSAAKEVIDLSPHLGTELVGLQLAELSNQQRDELALLVAERTVVFFRDQHALTPQAQRDLGAYLGEVEVHPTAAQVPGLPGVSIIWDRLASEEKGFRKPYVSQEWHTDLAHETQPPGYTHFHPDTIPNVGGDTYWASGYAAYDKLSPAFRERIDGLQVVFSSYHSYNDPATGDKVHIERVHPLVRVHPVTGWKSLFLNRQSASRIVGFEAGESKALLEYLFAVYEQTLDIQVRFKWSPRTSAIWDNRISIHAAVYDHEGKEPRHGTRVSSLAEVPINKPAPSRREALGLDKPEDFQFRDRKVLPVR